MAQATPGGALAPQEGAVLGLVVVCLLCCTYGVCFLQTQVNPIKYKIFCIFGFYKKKPPAILMHILQYSGITA
jgi:hypothetical protein